MKNKVSLLMLLMVASVIFSIPAFSFGGPAPEPQSTPADNPSPVAVENNRVVEIDKARAEIKDLKGQLDRLEKFNWSLDQKMQDARKAGNSKKLLELKESEQSTLERARAIKDAIAKKKEMYPELKVSEALENSKATQPNGALIPVVTVPTPVPAPAPMTIRQPAPTPRSAQASNKIFYHEVELGDTLMNISRKYFGNASMYKAIAQSNGILPNSGLRQGQLIKIDMRLKSMAPQRAVPIYPPVQPVQQQIIEQSYPQDQPVEQVVEPL